MSKIPDGLKEAIAFANGEIPGARLTINGHDVYVPEASLPKAINQLTEYLRAIARLTAPGNRTMDVLVRDMDQASDLARLALQVIITPREAVG